MDESRKTVGKLGTPPPHSWTRTGCITCKKRKKKCDESRPRCKNCDRLGYACEGYSTIWTISPAPSRVAARLPRLAVLPSRGSDLGQLSASLYHVSQSSPPSSKAKELSPHCLGIETERISSSNSGNFKHCTDSGEFFESCPSSANVGIDAVVTECIHTHDALALYSPTLWNVSSPISGERMRFLQYYIERASDRLINLEIADNPLRTLVLPRASSSILVLNALCALAACHHSNTSQGLELQSSTRALSYYSRTLQDLRKSLEVNCSGNNDDLLPSTDSILTAALLCKYEIVSGSTKQWPLHLKAVQRLVALRGGFDTLDHDLRGFLSGLYEYHNNMSRLTNLEHFPYELSDTINTSVGGKIDVYNGFTAYLAFLCTKISNLYRIKPLNCNNIKLLYPQISHINTQLNHWTCSATSYVVPRGVSVAALSRLEIVANSFRYAAFVYLHSMLEYISLKSSGIQSASLILPYSEISYTKLEAIDHVLRIVRGCLPLTHSEYSALCFPLFCAGCESESGDHRMFVLYCLDQLELNFGIGNTSRVKALIQHIWISKIVDGVKKHWIEALEELGWELILT